MFAELEYLTPVAPMDQQSTAITERELRELRAAEARHRSLLLREGQMLHYADTRDTRCAAFWSHDDLSPSAYPLPSHRGDVRNCALAHSTLSITTP